MNEQEFRDSKRAAIRKHAALLGAAIIDQNNAKDLPQLLSALRRQTAIRSQIQAIAAQHWQTADRFKGESYIVKERPTTALPQGENQ